MIKPNSNETKGGLSTLCSRCALLSKTCCRNSDIYLTTGDVRRIAGITSRKDFFEFRTPSDPVYTDQADDPVWFTSVFRTDGSRRVMKQDKTGNCVFLEGSGCRLTMRARPLVCRLHPHLYNSKQIYASISADCPLSLMESDERIENLIQGFDWKKARLWHEMLYKEINQETENHVDRSDV